MRPLRLIKGNNKPLGLNSIFLLFFCAEHDAHEHRMDHVFMLVLQDGI
jgi:hypothetical protein